LPYAKRVAKYTQKKKKRRKKGKKDQKTETKRRKTGGGEGFEGGRNVGSEGGRTSYQ